MIVDKSPGKPPSLRFSTSYYDDLASTSFYVVDIILEAPTVAPAALETLVASYEEPPALALLNPELTAASSPNPLVD